MARGRRALPDEVKALKGNPGKRRLALRDRAKDKASAGKMELPKLALTVPDFLTNEREREIFKKVVEDYLQRRVARGPDLTAYARWAAYVHRWWNCKGQLDGKSTWFKSTSKHGELLRRHPLFKDMLDLERVLQSLEDRLGLNPTARQNIIRGLSAMPAAIGGLFGEEKSAADIDKPPPDDEPDVPVPADSPLGWMQNAGKPH